VSLAQHFEISDCECQIRLTKLFSKMGVQRVYDMQTAIDLELQFATDEFYQRIGSGKAIGNLGVRGLF
jgi:hypothetical protein